MTDDQEPWDLAEMYARALRLCGRAFGGITPDAMTDPTPCADWDVRTLANHLVFEHLTTPRLLAGEAFDEVAASLGGDLLGIDATAAYERTAAAASSAMYAPGALRAEVSWLRGTISGEQLCARRTVNALVYGWDLAETLGLEYRVPPDLAAMTAEHVATHAAAPADAANPVGSAAVAVADDADPWARALAALGRKAG